MAKRGRPPTPEKKRGKPIYVGLDGYHAAQRLAKTVKLPMAQVAFRLLVAIDSAPASLQQALLGKVPPEHKDAFLRSISNHFELMLPNAEEAEQRREAK